MRNSVVSVLLPSLSFAGALLTPRLAAPAGGREALAIKKKMLVLGGTGFVGSRVCEEAIKKGYAVTALSRRGQNPKPDDAQLSQVNWLTCDATEEAQLGKIMSEVDPDVVVHAVGLLFDIDSGLANLNLVVSGSKSVPGEKSTYDAITRQTAENALKNTISPRNPLKSLKKRTFVFVSAAEAGWPEVPLGDRVESLAPEWLVRYLGAKRSVEASLLNAQSNNFRPVIFRPSLIWTWSKLDVLPVIPVFNIASAIGLPFVDKTVRVEDLAAAIVEAAGTESVSGIQRFKEVEELSSKSRV